MKNKLYLEKEVPRLLGVEEEVAMNAIELVKHKSMTDSVLFICSSTHKGGYVKALTTEGVLMVAHELAFVIGFDRMYDILVKLLRNDKLEMKPYKRNKMIMESYIFEKFLEECIEKREGTNKKSKDVYEHYVEFCKKNDERPLSHTAFGKKLVERIDKIKKQDGMYYKNIRLKHN